MVGLAAMEGGGTLLPSSPCFLLPITFGEANCAKAVRDCGDDSGTLRASDENSYMMSTLYITLV